MKQLHSLFSSIIILGACTAQADNISSRDNLLLLSQTHYSHEISDNNQNSYNLSYSTEDLKIVIGGASDLFGTNVLYKFDPMHDRKWFVKTGAGYSYQQFSTAKYTALFGSLASGYMVQDNLYIEVGGSATKLDSDNAITDETTKNVGIHATKRWESAIGTLDTSVGVNRIYQNISNENYYIGAINYYPVDNARLGFSYSYSEQSISNNFAFAYGYLYANYTNNITYDSRNVTVGIQCAFSNVTDFSSYKMPTNIKPHISE
jgi:hypothetical protein